MRSSTWLGDARLLVDRTWDGQPARPGEVAELRLACTAEGLRVFVDAPFHGDPPPAGPSGRTDGLWEHEVVELFLLGSQQRYLELEVGPHGHFLALRFAGPRRREGDDPSITCEVALERGRGRWRAVLRVAHAELPPGLERVNAYAIHGTGAHRRYLAAAPVPGARPDFHRPECFLALASAARTS